MVFILSFFIKVIITPIKANTDANNEIPSDFKDTKIPVTVVPIFAPIIIAVACVSVIIPAFTNPIAITVVAAEL